MLEKILRTAFLVGALAACSGEEPADDCSARIGLDDDTFCPGSNRVAVDDNGNGCIDRCAYVSEDSGVDSGRGDVSIDVGVDGGYDTHLDAAPQEELEIVGTYLDELGLVHEITSDYWNIIFPEPISTSRIIVFNNDENYLVRGNIEVSDNSHFQIVYWINFSGSDFNACFSPNRFDTVGAALEVPPDATNLETGCFGYNWAFLSPN